MKKFKRLSVLMLTVILALTSFTTTAFAATTMGYNAVATTSSSTYEDNAPINRVFYVKTGSSTASRTLKFEQTAGEISYYMYRNTSKTCYQKKNTNYIVFVYPEDFDAILNKYLTTKILNLRPIINGYSKSPHWTITTDATIKYSESDSIKIAGV